MKVFRLFAMLFGAVAMLTGFNSCSKDETECCSMSGTYDGETYSVKVCEDGKVTYKYGSSTYTYNWKEDNEDGLTWSVIKASAKEEGASCS